MKTGFFARNATLSTRSSFLAVFGFQIDWLFEIFCQLFVCFCYIFLQIFLYCSGGALCILLDLPANMKTPGEEIILEISSFICSWKSSVDFLYFRELTILYKTFSNVSNSLHWPGWCLDWKLYVSLTILLLVLLAFFWKSVLSSAFV